MGIYYNQLVRELKKTALSERTHESYIYQMRRLVLHYSRLSPDRIVEEQVTDYLLFLKDRGYAPSTINQARCALKFFFSHVVERPDWRIFDEFKVGKRNDRRPALSIEEVWRVLDAIQTPHNRAALVSIYLCGLRISECVSLQVGDIHSGDGMLHVHRGKGARSRYVPLPTTVLGLLRSHWKTHRNPLLVFPARGRGTRAGDATTTTRPLPLTSIQTVFKKALAEVRINKRGVSVHSLRHSYATHLLEFGVPTEHVKHFLGHKHLATTERYIHITPSGFAESRQKIERLAEYYHER